LRISPLSIKYYLNVVDYIWVVDIAHSSWAYEYTSCGIVALIGPQISENWPRTIRATVSQLMNTRDMWKTENKDVKTWSLMQRDPWKIHVMIPLLINQSNISRNFSLQLSKCLADFRSSCYWTDELGQYGKPITRPIWKTSRNNTIILDFHKNY
jgi:hypothetical protein